MQSNKKQLINKTEKDSKDFKTKLRVLKEETLRGEIKWEAEIGIYTLLYTKSIGNKDLVYSLDLVYS